MRKRALQIRLFSKCQRFWRGTLFFLFTIGWTVAATNPAVALPSFGIQTNQPCSACHIGGFGPRLKQAGRDFKLYGYSASDLHDHFPPISVIGEASFTHTSTDELVSALKAENDRTAFEGAALFYGGKILSNMGAFAEVEYEAVERKLHWEDFDVRYARDRTIKGHDIVYGLTLNNSPSVEDLWDSEPAWVFPFIGSSYEPSPAATPLIDQIGSTVLGLGVYAMWDDTIYAQVAAYGGLNRDTLKVFGAEPLNGADDISGAIPYWRFTLQKEIEDGRHYFALGTYGLTANIRPQSIPGIGQDSYSDIAVDATYQWIPHPELSVSDVISVHALYLHENADLNASRIAFGTRSSDSLNVFRGDITYSYDATLTPTLQYFHISGTADPARWPSASGSPDSAGFVAELDYVPWGKPDAPLAWLNGRLALQYIAYTKFDGVTQNASDNNTLLLHLTVALALNR